MNKALSVWWGGRVAGTLKLSNTGGMTFGYSPEWLADPASPALSISLPRREQRFAERECRPFFSGLLPEEGQRDAAAAALGLSKHNDFALLDALGGDVAGALTLWPEATTPPTLVSPASTPLTDHQLDELIAALLKRPLLAGGELRLSLAGAQPKVPVVLVDGRIALPAHGEPTTHILKPAIERFAGTVENEALVMKLAAAVGLEVAAVELRTAGSRPFLLVTRYDRTAGDRGVDRLHQEDFCQAMGIAPETKYEKEGGPTLARCFALLRRIATRPAVDVLKLVDAVIFNVIAGNADAHGKNYSLLYADDELRLAPLYDLLCTTAYPELSPRLAMKVGGRATIEEMGAKTWPAFAEAAGVAAPFVRRRVAALCDAVRAQLPEVTSQFSQRSDLEAVQRVTALIESRAVRLAERTLAG